MKNDLLRFRSLVSFAIVPRMFLFRMMAVLGAACFLLGFAPARADEKAAEAAPPVENKTGDDLEVLAVIRVPPPKELTEKILSVARKIQPGPQTESLPFMLGGMLGDPMLEGISATENVGFALVSNGGEIQPVLVLKLTEESPLRQSLPNFEMSLQDFEGWTFGLPEGISPTWIEGKENELIAAAGAARRYDVEVTADGPALAEKLREVAGEFPEMGALDEIFVRPMIEGLAAEADAVRDFRIGFDLSAEQIRQVFFMEAAPGSAMAAFFSQKRPANLDFARFIEADEAVAYLGGFDVGATRQYFDHFFKGLAGEKNGDGENVWQKVHDLGARFLDSTDGRSGGVLSLDGMQVEMTSVSPSNLTDSELVEMLREMVGAMSQLTQAESAREEAPMPSYELLLNQLEVSGVPVHVLRTELKMDPEELAELEKQMPGFVNPGQQQDMHYAVVGGYLVNTSTVAGVTALIETIQRDEAVENNLASLIQVDEGDLFEFQVDLVRYVGGIMKAMMSPDLAVVLEKLQKQNLKPMTGSASAQNGSAEMQLSIPVDTLAAVFRSMSEYMAAQQEAQQPAPSANPGS